jgi:hypothetical protein
MIINKSILLYKKKKSVHDNLKKKSCFQKEKK